MSDRGIGMEGNFHDRTPLAVEDQDVLESRPEYTKEDLEQEIAAYEASLTDGEKQVLKMLGNTVEGSYLNDLIGTLPLAGLQKKREWYLGNMQGSEAKVDESNTDLQKKIKFLNDIDDLVEGLKSKGVNLTDPGTDNLRKVLDANSDAIKMIYVELRKRGYSTEDILPATRKAKKLTTQQEFNA